MLNRVLRLTPEGISYEADPRHAELLEMMLGPSPTSVATPGARPPGTGGQRLEAVSREQFLRGVGVEEGKVLDVVDRDG